jgi:methylglutaconyl-CoA hydratase
MPDLVLSTFSDGVLTISLDRPDKRNALSLELIEALRDAVEHAHRCDDVRVVVLTGEGKTFCAGMDLRGVITDVPAMTNMLRTLALTSLRIRALPVPTIARVNGGAIGGGCGLAVVCDVAITHHDARLGYPEVDLGVCPAVVAPLLIRKIGAGRARAVLLRGGTMSGDEAKAIGMVDMVTDAAGLDAAVATAAAKFCSGGRRALSVTKNWLNELDGSLDETVALRAAALSAEVIAGSEAQASLRRLFGE